MKRSAPMNRLHRPAALVAAVAVLASLLTFSISAPPIAEAAIERPFVQRANFNTTGYLDLIGNTSMTCPVANVTRMNQTTLTPTTDPACAATQTNRVPNQNGATRFTNNQFTMQWVDIDGTNPQPLLAGGTVDTFNSSAADLILPAGAQVLYAGLYWNADTSAGGTSSPNPTGITTTAAPTRAARTQVLLRVPNSSGYQTITAPSTRFNDLGTTYNASADITTLVRPQAGGTTGRYSLANLQVGTGTNRYGGWSIVVVVQDPSQPIRNLTVFDGYARVDGATPTITVTPSGFSTPTTGVVNARVGAVAFDGDRTSTGDRLLLNNVALGTGIRPTNDFFNSTISDFGVYATAADPAYTNNLGVDIARVDASGILPNGATSASVQMTTGGETVDLSVLTFTVSLNAPKLDAVKSVVDLNGGDVRVGDTLEYTVNVTNSGLDGSTNSRFVDPIPAGSTYVAGSIRVNGSARTDAAGDDQAEFGSDPVGGAPAVIGRIGTGASATQGGAIPVNGTATVTFRVTVNEVPNNTVVTNQARFSYVAAVSGASLDGLSNAVRSPVNNPRADMSLTKVADQTPMVAGTTSSYTLRATNNGPDTAAGAITITDTIPAPLVYAGFTGTGWSCTAATPTASGTPVTCTRSSSLGAGVTAPDLQLQVAVPAATTVTSLTNTATVSSPTPETLGAGSLDNNTATAPTTLQAQADLAVVKTLDTATVVAGQAVSFTLAARNLGPSAAAAGAGQVVSVADQIPAGLTYTGATGTGWTCPAGPTVGPATITCTTPGPVAASTALPPITVNATVGASVAVATTNTATISSPTAQPANSTANDTSSVTFTPAASTDLAITKTASGQFNPGQGGTFTVTVSNLGPSALRPGQTVQFTDPLPAGLTLSSTSGAGWSCTGTTTATCTYTVPAGGVAVNGSFAAVLNVSVSSGSGNTFTNTATLVNPPNDPNPANNASTVSTTTTQTADVTIVKTAVGAVTAGDTATYRLVAANSVGSFDAPSVTITDVLPTGLTFRSATPPGLCSGTTTVTCALGTLAGGTTPGSVTIDVIVDVGPGVTGTITNTASISSALPDPDPTDNTSSVTTPVVVSADLVVTKGPDTPTFVAGGTGTYTVVVRNAGLASAPGTALIDNLPAGMVVTDYTAPAGVTCTPTRPLPPAGVSTITCSLDSPLAPGAQVSIGLTVAVGPGVVDGTQLSNTASATSSVNDPDPTNNTNIGIPVTIRTSADLTIVKTDSGPITAGTATTYTLQVTNAGPSTAAGPITVTETLPPQLIYVAGSGTGWTCGPSGQIVTCSLAGPLAVGPAPALTIAARARTSATGPIVNTAQVRSATTDPNPSNDSATVTTALVVVADLLVQKRPLDEAVAGAPMRWEIIVRNQGPSVAPSPITVTDAVGPGLTLVSLASADSNWSCTGATCTYDAPIPLNGQTPPLIATTNVAPTATGNVVNNASATSTAIDPFPNDNTDVGATAPVAVRADLALAKAVSTDPVVAGGTAAYTLTTTNNGPATLATGTVLTVVDTLPSGMTRSGSTAPWTCTGTGVQTCSLSLTAPMPAGATRTLTLPVTIDAALRTTPLVNRATVSSTVTDPDPSNNDASNTVGLVTRADLGVVKTAGAPLITAGATGTYLLQVNNAGPSVALAPVTVTDTLPAGLSLVTATAPWACVASGQRVDCSLPTDVAVGAAPPLTLTVRADADLSRNTVLRNTALVGSATSDPNSANDTSFVDVTVNESAQLRVTKQRQGAVVAGSVATWSVSVRNDGPSNARAPITVTDILPTGFTYASTSAPWSCTAADPARPVCTFDGDLAAGQTAPLLVIGANVPLTAAGVDVTNRVEVTSAGDPTVYPATDGGGVVVDRNDLTIVKDIVTPVIGVPATFSLIVTNLGPSRLAAGRTVTVTDDLAAVGKTFAGTFTGAGWSCSGSPLVTCSFTVPAAGVDVDATLPSLRITTAEALTAADATRVNTATVATTATDPVPGNNSASVPLTATSRADVEVVKDQGASVVAGGTTQYRIRITNNGPSPATDVRLIDSLPAPLTFASLSGTSTGVDNPFSACAPTVGGSSLDCVASRAIANGETVTLLVTAAAPPSAGANNVTNTAIVQSSTVDPSPANDSSSTPTSITRAADVRITKTASSAITAGATGGYVITVSNPVGPSDARQVSVSDTLPTGLTVTSLVGTGPFSTCTATVGATSVTCAADAPIAVGASHTITLGVAVRPGVVGPITNTAEVSSATPDPTPANNEASTVDPVIRRADLTITKRVVGAAVAGQPVTYEITPRNIGPAAVLAADTVTITDVVPPGVLTPLASGSGWVCTLGAPTAAGTPVSCTSDGSEPIGVGSSAAAVVITGTLDAGVTAPITNNATVALSGGTTDPNAANDDASVTATPGTSADVSITKALTGLLVPGTSATYTITLANAGPSASQPSLRIADTLPAGLSFLSATGTDITCSASGQTVTCNRLTALAPGASATVTLQVNVAPGVTGAVANTAEIVGPLVTPDPDLSDNRDTVTVQAAPSADLVARKSVSPTTLLAGTQAVYRLSVENRGPSSAAAPVSITDTLPPGLTYLSAPSQSGWSCAPNGQRVECQQTSPIPPGVTGEVFVNVLVEPNVAAGTVITNSAVASSTTPDPDATNDTATAPITVNVAADLAVTKVHDPEPFVRGRPGTYTVRVVNNGPSTVPAGRTLTVTDTLPPGQTLAPTANTAPWTCSTIGTPQVVTCTLALATPLALGGTLELPLRVDVDTLADPGGVANSVTVDPAPGYPDPQLANNTDTDRATVVGRADLSVVKTNDPSTFVAGQPATYTLAITNAGPSAAVNPKLTDLLPAGITVGTPVVPTGWTCAVDPGTVECSGALLLNGATATITLPVNVLSSTAPQVLRNTARIVSDTPDENPGNDTVTNDTPVLVSSDVSITKTADQTTPVAGTTTRYTLGVRNAGPSNTGRPLTITDTLPAGATFVSSDSGVPCAASGQTVTCSIDQDLVPGPTPRTFGITVRLGAGVAGSTMVNNAELVAPNADPTIPNITGPVPFTPRAEADLEITKTIIDSPPFVPGERVSFELRASNAGPSDAAAPVVVDTLPAGLRFVSATGAGWACSANGQVVTCTASGTLPAPAPGGPPVGAAPITVTADIEPRATGTVSNTASVASITPEPPGGTRTDAIVPVPLTPQADLEITKVPLGPAIAGRTAAFAITVTNRGPSVRTAPIEVTDTLGSGLSGLTLDGGSDWDCTTATAACTTDLDLQPGQSAPTITARVDVSPSASSGVLTTANTAAITADPSDPDTSNDTATSPLTIGVEADLAITKDTRRADGTSGSIAAGETGRYIIDVVNNGPSTIPAGTSFSIVDTLPPGLSVTGQPADPTWTCTGPFPATGSVTCTQNLAVPFARGGTAPALVLPVRLAADVNATTSTNQVRVVAPSSFPDPITANDTASDTVGVFTQANLSVRKRVNAEPLVPGRTYDYTLLVANAGPSVAALPVVVTDVLPPGIRYDGLDSATPPVWACSATGVPTTGQTVTCTRSQALPVRGDGTNGTVLQDDTIALRVTVLPSVTAPAVTNVVSGSSGTTDPQPGNNTFDLPSTVVPQADLAISKTLDPPGLVGGAEATYTVTVTNAGPSDAAGPLTVIDTLPAGMSFVRANGDGWSCIDTSGVLACTRTTGLAGPAGGAPTATSFALTVTTPSGSAGAELANTARVSSPTSEVLDPATGGVISDANNVVTTPLATVTASADVATTKVLVGPVVAGASAQYRITVTNSGPSDAMAVRVVDPLPTGMTRTGGDARCTGTTTVTCVIGTMAARSSTVIDLTVAVAATATGLLRNTATASSPTDDPAPGNNSGTADALIGFAADLRLTKRVVTSPVVAGLPVTFELVVRNDGPSPATNASITDDLPAGLTFSSSTGSVCTAVGQQLTCPVGGIGPGASATVTVTADVDPTLSGPAANTATITADTPDPDTSPESNQSTAPFVVTAVADLSVTKTLDTDPLVPGRPATWTINVTNAGFSVAADTVVTDTLPAGLLAGDGTDARCTGTTTLICEAGTLAVGQTVGFRVVTSVAPGSTGTITNSATATSAATDPDGATGGASGVLSPTVDRSVRLVPRGGPLVAGAVLTVDVIVGNAGPSDAASTEVRLPVPVGTSYAGTDPRCTLEGAEVVCRIGTVPSGGTTSFAVAWSISPTATGPIALSATVGGAGRDTNATNDAATGSVPTIARAIELTVTGECRLDVPWLTYEVTGNFPFEQATLTFAGSDGTAGETTRVGPTGARPWPGAAAGSDGRGTDWPGWSLEGGTWVRADDGFTWARPTMTVTAEVNPTATTTVDYPVGCGDPGLPIPIPLPVTGGDARTPITIAIALLAGGLGLLLSTRRRRTSDADEGRAGI